MAHAAPSFCPPEDSAAVAATVQQMYKAMAAGDAAKSRTFFSQEFYILDSGSLYTTDGLIFAVEQSQKSGKSYTWTVSEPRVHFACDSAWMSHVNRGTVTTSGRETPVDWLESAILHWRNGRWKIDFMTSMPASTPDGH
jgi:hypothetical protein